MNLEMIKETTQNQLEILRRILNLEKDKYEQLLSGKLTDFSQTNQKLLQEIEQLEISELQRVETLESFIAQKGAFAGNSADIHFSNIVQSLEGSDQHAPMEALYKNMKETVDQIRHYTTINKDLIEMALNVLNITLGQQGKEIDYTRRSETKKNHSLLVNKVI